MEAGHTQADVESALSPAEASGVLPAHVDTQVEQVPRVPLLRLEGFEGPMDRSSRPAA